MSHSPADTPLMRQYLEVKQRHAEAIVFFRLGDFYEMFFEDAITASRALDLTLTTRDKGREDAVPMCGVPHHAARGYIARLLELGHKVAICEQVEDPRLARGIVRREVVRLVTPGVVLDEENLEPRRGRYLAALVSADILASQVVPSTPCPSASPTTSPTTPTTPTTSPTAITAPANQATAAEAAALPAAATTARRASSAGFGLAYLDVTTGEFCATELADLGALRAELARVEPSELLVSQQARSLLAACQPRPGAWAITSLEPGVPADDDQLLRETLAATPAELGLDDLPRCRAAAAAVVRYARRTQPEGRLPVSRLLVYHPSDTLLLDETTRANLELCETLVGRQKRGSLLGILDQTCTAMGGRLLRRWLSAPLLEVAAIRRRQDAVEALVEQAALRRELRRELAEVHDLERLAGRASLRVATARDLAALRRSLERLPAIAARLAGAQDCDLAPPELLSLDPDLCTEVAAAIAGTLLDDPPLDGKDADLIRPGRSPELDRLRGLRDGGKSRILEIEARERQRTGIASLKVRYNRVFGYYLEVTRANLASVPADYRRKQTLANAERFVTAELAELEEQMLHAEERRQLLEEELFAALRAEVAAAAARLTSLATSVARLDVLAGLAEVAHTSGYHRPLVDDGERLEIEDGRHPVVERFSAPGGFVPNDLRLDPREQQLLIITGPNMAGKSTVMRQAALISILAQCGSFVPARRARLGIVDRIFTRVGAADAISRGESTFMVEMRETAHILRHATRRSLVVLDEIGRGTATYDGISIAWAVGEYLHDVVGAKTLFATHYHELCALAEARPRVRNYNIAVREWRGEVVFLRKLVPGAASRSYGIAVGRLAGLPPPVLARAREVLAELERVDPGAASPAHGRTPLATPQLSLFSPRPAPLPAPPSDLELVLAATDVDGLTPRQALGLLGELCQQARDRARPAPGQDSPGDSGTEREEA